MSDNLDPQRAEALREVEEEAGRAARGAQGYRDENERGMHRGQDTDYAFRLPPDMAHADRVRSADDVELADRQEQMADAQRQAAETLRRNAELLNGTARELDRAVDAVRDNRADIQDIQQNTEELRAQTAQAREQVDNARIPDVDEGDHEKGNGRGDAKEAGNG